MSESPLTVYVYYTHSHPLGDYSRIERIRAVSLEQLTLNADPNYSVSESGRRWSFDTRWEAVAIDPAQSTHLHIYSVEEEDYSSAENLVIHGSNSATLEREELPTDEYVHYRYGEHALVLVLADLQEHSTITVF